MRSCVSFGGVGTKGLGPGPEEPPPAGGGITTITLVWAAFVFVFFSASGSKLPTYILPMFAPLALVAGDLLLRQDPRDLARQALPGAIVVSVIAAALLLGYHRIVARFADGPQPIEILEAYGPWLKAAVLINPMVYMSEGFRAALSIGVVHMPLGAIYGALLGFSILFTVLGVRGFKKRVLS